MAKYKVGDKVKIVDKWVDAFTVNWDGLMDKWLGKNMTIRKEDTMFGGTAYYMDEDKDENNGTGWRWAEENIECLVNDTTAPIAPKFKVGDKVKVIGNHGETTFDNGETGSINHYYEIGTIVTILDYVSDGVYFCKEGDFHYQYVAPCDLALVTDSNDTNATNDTPKDDCYFEFAGFKYGDRVKVYGSAFVQDGAIGTVIARDMFDLIGVEFDDANCFMGHACNNHIRGRSGNDGHCLWCCPDSLTVISTTPTDTPTNTIEYYNGKVVCVDARYNGYTVGKIYQFQDGKLTDDTGHKHPWNIGVKSFAEWCDWTDSKFIEIVD